MWSKRTLINAFVNCCERGFYIEYLAYKVRAANPIIRLKLNYSITGSTTHGKFSIHIHYFLEYINPISTKVGEFYDAHSMELCMVVYRSTTDGSNSLILVMFGCNVMPLKGSITPYILNVLIHLQHGGGCVNLWGESATIKIWQAVRTYLAPIKHRNL
jgi:hypothetical protein